MMHPGVTVARQALAIHKTLVHNGFRTLSLLQERGNQVVRSFLAPGAGHPADAHRLWEGWSETGQTGREVFEAAVDVYFEMLAGMMLPSDRDR